MYNRALNDQSSCKENMPWQSQFPSAVWPQKHLQFQQGCKGRKAKGYEAQQGQWSKFSNFIF